jgi:hypothetical protein
MDNYIDNNSNTHCWICQERDLEDCNCCDHLETCNFWNDDFEEDLDDYKYYWFEMSYRKFIERAIEFKHSELQ